MNASPENERKISLYKKKNLMELQSNVTVLKVIIKQSIQSNTEVYYQSLNTQGNRKPLLGLHSAKNWFQRFIFQGEKT